MMDGNQLDLLSGLDNCGLEMFMGPAEAAAVERIVAAAAIAAMRMRVILSSMRPRERVELSSASAVFSSFHLFAEFVEFRLLFGVEAFVESDQFRIFRFHRLQPILKEGLVETETPFKRGQVRLGRAEAGRRRFDGFAPRILKILEGRFLGVRQLQACGQKFREFGFMRGPVGMGSANAFELAAGSAPAAFRRLRRPKSRVRQPQPRQ